MAKALSGVVRIMGFAANDGPGVDPVFAPLLADPRNALRPPPPTMSLARFREIADAPMAAVIGPDVARVEVHAAQGPAGPIPLRLYRPSLAPGLPAVLFLHGGGFVIGSLETHDAMCRMLAVLSGSAILSVGYRLAPEAPYPAPVDDCHAALGWLAAQAAALGLDETRLAICGDSAGGHLAIATALRARGDGPALRHVGLIYPVVAPACDTRSAHELGTGYLLTRECLLWFWSCYLGAAVDPAVADMLRADLAGLPPITVLTAEYDPLRDEGEAFAARARAAGVAVVARRYLGMIHGFASLPALGPVAGRAIGDLAADMRAVLMRDEIPANGAGCFFVNGSVDTTRMADVGEDL